MKNYEKHIQSILKAFSRNSASCSLAKKYVLKTEACLQAGVSCMKCQDLTYQWLNSECEE